MACYMSKQYTKAEIKKMAKEAAEWAASPEGQKALADSVEEAMRVTEELRRKRQMSWDEWDRLMRKPFDI